VLGVVDGRLALLEEVVHFGEQLRAVLAHIPAARGGLADAEGHHQVIAGSRQPLRLVRGKNQGVSFSCGHLRGNTAVVEMERRCLETDPRVVSGEGIHPRPEG